MDFQSIAVILCVAIAMVFLARELWRTWHPNQNGCGGCGCADRSASIDEREPSRVELPMQNTANRGS